MFPAAPKRIDEPAHERLAAAIEGSDLPKYVYSYPSKYAYRSLPATRTLERIWSPVTGPVNLYIHIPFCGYRCSFCTLFLTTQHSDDMRQRYVDALIRQIAMYGGLLNNVEIESLYIGGGTPTVLRSRQYEAIFESLRRAFPAWHPDAEIAIEGSPDTMRRSLLETLSSLGVNRVSMGLQTLDEDERKHVGRRYGMETVHAAVDAIQGVGFENVNYDLIYGLEGQTKTSWFESLQGTLAFAPRTVTLYPVIFRPLTSIIKRKSTRAERFLANASKYAIYDQSVDFLRERDFQQNSFVRFSTCSDDGLRQEASDFSGTPLLGFGAGARSYTQHVHYGTDFAVRRGRTSTIITSFIDRHQQAEDVPGLGFELDDDERQRRFCILNLSLGNLDASIYRDRFAGRVEDRFGDELDALCEQGCITVDDDRYQLTRRGFKYSNVIATLFQSTHVSNLEASYEPG